MTASAVPSGAPGYNDKDELGNFITHLSPTVCEGCAAYTWPRLKVKPQHSVRPYPALCRKAMTFLPRTEDFRPCRPILRRPRTDRTSSLQVEDDLPGEI